MPFGAAEGLHFALERFPVVTVLVLFGADFGVAVTGIAGPDGGSAAKPVGTVWIAVADAGGTVAKLRCFPTTREHVKLWSSQQALDLLRRRLTGC